MLLMENKKLRFFSLICGIIIGHFTIRVKNMSAVQFLDDEVVIHNYLENNFGVSKKALMGVVQQAAFAYGSSTKYHPVIHSGSSAWFEIVRSLRELLVPKGWQCLYEAGLDKTISKDFGVSIVCTGGNSAVGKINAQSLLSKNDKGSAFDRLLEQNRRQLELFDSNEFLSSPVDDNTTWVLIYHVDKSAKEIRAELSLPVFLNEKSKIQGWKTRIFLGTVSLDNLKTSTLSESEFSEAIEIPVISKKNE